LYGRSTCPLKPGTCSCLQCIISAIVMHHQGAIWLPTRDLVNSSLLASTPAPHSVQGFCKMKNAVCKSQLACTSYGRMALLQSRSQTAAQPEVDTHARVCPCQGLSFCPHRCIGILQTVGFGRLPTNRGRPFACAGFERAVKLHTQVPAVVG